MASGSKREENLSPLILMGLNIQRAREKCRFSVKQLSEKTKVSSRYISCIEAGEFGELPGRTYVVGFTRSICLALGLEPEEVIQVIKSELYKQHDVLP